MRAGDTRCPLHPAIEALPDFPCHGMRKSYCGLGDCFQRKTLFSRSTIGISKGLCARLPTSAASTIRATRAGWNRTLRSAASLALAASPPARMASLTTRPARTTARIHATRRYGAAWHFVAERGWAPIERGREAGSLALCAEAEVYGKMLKHSQYLRRKSYYLAEHAPQNHIPHILLRGACAPSCQNQQNIY